MKLQRYETMFISSPVLTEEESREVTNKVLAFLKKKGAALVERDDQGIKRLAYPIKKHLTGFYTLLEYDLSPTEIQTFTTYLTQNEEIVRFTTIHMDQHGIAYKKKQREKKQNSISEKDAESK